MFYNIPRRLPLLLIQVCIGLSLLEECTCSKPTPIQPSLLPAKPAPISRRSGKSQGIPNLGSSCYMNAVIQVLAAFYKDQIATVTSSPLADTTNDLLKTLTDTCPATPSILQGKAKSFFDEAMSSSGTGLGFTLDRQQDAAELLNALLDYFKVPKASSPGSFINTITKEKQIDTSNSSWRIKQVPISDKNENESMQTLFNASMKPEEISKKWNKNDKDDIKVHRESKLQDIDKLPVLPIQLVRMQGYDAATDKTLKVNVPISTPLNLIIKKEYIKWDNKDLQKDLHYELVGFIVHHSSTGNSGHYVSYIKEGEQWILYDDSKVSEVTISEAKEAAQEAYIFFYQPQKP
jgi:ubiquitin C-terminal hydrolase